MAAFVDQLRLLYSNEFYEDLCALVEMVLCACARSQEPSLQIFTPHQRARVLVYHADSLRQLGELNKAVDVYQRALQLRRSIKVKPKQQYAELPTEVEIKYKISQCYCRLKRYNEAMTELCSIPRKHWDVKVYMALSKLYQIYAPNRAVTGALKEVLRECPLAMNAMLRLAKLGVKPCEILSLVGEHSQQLPWLPSLLKAHYMQSGCSGPTASGLSAHSAPSGAGAKEPTQCATAFIREMQQPDMSTLRDCPAVLCSIAEANFHAGNGDAARQTYERAKKLDPYLLTGMDTLAYLYYQDRKSLPQLEAHAASLLSVSDTRPEPWVALGYACLHQKRMLPRVIYFAQKALSLDGRCVMALCLKGEALLHHNRHVEASQHFKEAIRLMPTLLDAHRGVVACYVAQNRLKDAYALAVNALSKFPNSPRAVTLYSSVAMKHRASLLASGSSATSSGGDGASQSNSASTNAAAQALEKIKGLLEKSRASNPDHLDTVYQLVDVFCTEQDYQKASALLKQTLERHSVAQLHVLLANCLLKLQRVEDALNEFSIALSLEPGNTQARDGLETIDLGGGVAAAMNVNVGTAAGVAVGGSTSSGAIGGSNLFSLVDTGSTGSVDVQGGETDASDRENLDWSDPDSEIF